MSLFILLLLGQEVTSRMDNFFAGIPLSSESSLSCPIHAGLRHCLFVVHRSMVVKRNRTKCTSFTKSETLGLHVMDIVITGNFDLILEENDKIKYNHNWIMMGKFWRVVEDLMLNDILLNGCVITWTNDKQHHAKRNRSCVGFWLNGTRCFQDSFF